MSNLLKQCYVVNSSGQMRIINSNDRVNDRLKELGADAHVSEEAGQEVKQESADDSFSEGLEAPKIDAEAIRREAVEAAQAEADRITGQAQAEAQRMLAEADEQAKILFEEQKNLGYQEGARAKEEELEAKRAELEERTAARDRELSEDYHRKMDSMERDIVDAVVQVFDKVFQIQFGSKREILLALVTNTLMDVDSGNKIRIRANDADRAMLEEHLDEIQKTVGRDVSIEFMHDNKLTDGQCQIETSYGVFDCGIDTQFSNLIKDIRSLV